MKKKLVEMSCYHSYDCSDNNYFNSSTSCTFNTATEFLEEFEDSDEDYNLVFRWDITEKTDDNDKTTGEYNASVFFVLQRKGYFLPTFIENITPSELPRFKRFLKIRWEHLESLWSPISK